MAGNNKKRPRRSKKAQKRAKKVAKGARQSGPMVRWIKKQLGYNNNKKNNS